MAMTVWGDIGGVDSTSHIPDDTHEDPVRVVCPAAQRARKGGGQARCPRHSPGRLTQNPNKCACEWEKRYFHTSVSHDPW